jgi:cytochrome c oxidase assembly factor CtaG
MVALASGYPPDLAYTGPPKFTLSRAFTAWTVDVPMLVLIVAIGCWYLLSARQVRRQGGQWGIGRTFTFCVLGLGFWVIATMSWVGVYQSALFYARATQTVLLVLLAPLFLMMGKPITLLIEAQPPVGDRVAAVIRSRAAKIVTFPAITTVALVAIPMTMYFTTWYTAVFTSGTVRELTYLILMVPGLVFFWTLLRVDPVPKKYPYGVAMWITAAEVVGDAFFGIAIIADQTTLAAQHYHAVGYPFGPSLATSQVIGGGIIWILGDAVGLPFLAVQLIQMMREDKVEAAAIDAELDARDAAREAARAQRAASAAATAPAAATAGAGAGAGASPDHDAATHEADGADDDERPWWETDPRITNRYNRA